MSDDLSNDAGATTPNPASGALPPEGAVPAERLSADETTRQEDARRLVAQGGEMLLHQVRAADAAALFSQALQYAPNLLAAHLGMAEANFALGQFEITRMAALYVTRLAPDSQDAGIAKTLLYCLDQRFQLALETIDQVIRSESGMAYAHGLRAYIYRCMGNDYDASTEEAKSARLASTRDLRPLFPRVVRGAQTSAFAPPPFQNGQSARAAPRLEPIAPPRPVNDQIRRQQAQLRAMMSGTPIATYSIMAVTIGVFLLQQADPNITDLGAQVNYLVTQGEWWRLFTVMFLHENIIHIGVNMLSLFFIGPLTERLYGTRRYVLLYFGTGLIASLAFYFFAPPIAAAVGASGAIAGIFGVLGAYFFAFRDRLGPIAGGILTTMVLLARTERLAQRL